MNKEIMNSNEYAEALYYAQLGSPSKGRKAIYALIKFIVNQYKTADPPSPDIRKGVKE